MFQRGDCAMRVVHVGSNANNGSNAEVFCVNADNASSNANRNIGAQLAVILVIQHKTPVRLGEYVDPLQFGKATEELGDYQR